MSEKSEKILILGASGSGKDFLMRKLVEKGLKPCIKCTTRPIRKNEKQGVNYNFIKENDFKKLIEENKFLTYQSFEVTPENSEPKTWYYGITLEEFMEKQVLIMTPGELLTLPEDLRKGCFVVYLNIDREIRESRLHRRNDKNDSIKRRLDADELDFNIKNIDYDLSLTDPDFTADDVYDLMV
jgi:guanylate kinase